MSQPLIERDEAGSTWSDRTRRISVFPQTASVFVRMCSPVGVHCVVFEDGRRGVSDDTESVRDGCRGPRCCGSSDCCAGRGAGGVASLLDAGGTWGLGPEGTYSATGVRRVAAVVVLVAVAVLVVLARVGLWRQPFVSKAVRVNAWALTAFFLGHALVSFAEGWAGEPGRVVAVRPGRARDRTARVGRSGVRGAWLLSTGH